MILITTPTGITGRHVVDALLKAGQQLHLLVRDANKLPSRVRSHTEIVEGDLLDVKAVKRAITGVKSAFFCIPQYGDTQDVLAYYKRLSKPAADAFRSTAVTRVVTISGGRGNSSDSGPNGPLATMESMINASGVHTRHIRCGYFMENFLYTIPQIKYRGTFSLPITPDQRLALMSAQDIGRAAADLLLNADWVGQEGISVPHGASLTGAEIATILTSALNQPITFVPITGEE